MSTEDTALVLSGRYRLEERIGSGGAGAVWRATDTVLDRRVAVKLLHRELRTDGEASARFRREATAAAAITHPNAAVIYDIGEDDGRAYLVMELIDGPALVDVLDGTALDASLVAAIGHQVAGALGAAHGRGLAHRDVKPANILLTSTGAAKVADFGIAKALGDATAQLTATGKVMGTAAYLAPEQLEGGDVDQRADVYALGLVLFQCLTGRSPFNGATTAEVAAQRLVSDAPRPRQFEPGIPGPLDDIVAIATKRDRDERYQDGQALAAALAPHVPDDPGSHIAELVRWRPNREGTRALTVHDAAGMATQAIGVDEPTPAVSDDALTTADHAEAAADATQVIQPVAPRADRRDDATQAVGATAGTTPRREDLAPARQAPATASAATGTATASPTSTPDVIPEEHTSGDGKRRTAVWAGVGVIALAILATGLGTGGGSPEAGGEAGQEQAGAAGEPIRIAGGQDFDPPPGGGEEHREDVPKAFDGDASTYWTTERYDSANFGGLKPGVGIWFDLGAPTSVAQLQLITETPGLDLSVYASTTGVDPSLLQGEPAATASGIPGETTVDLAGVEGRYFLVWITNVPEGRARINEVEFDRA